MNCYVPWMFFVSRALSFSTPDYQGDTFRPTTPSAFAGTPSAIRCSLKARTQGHYQAEGSSSILLHNAAPCTACPRTSSGGTATHGSSTHRFTGLRKCPTV